MEPGTWNDFLFSEFSLVWLSAMPTYCEEISIIFIINTIIIMNALYILLYL